MIVVMNCGPGEMHCRALKCLTYMTPSLSAGALKGGQQVIAGLLRPKSRNGIFMEHEDADPRALVWPTLNKIAFESCVRWKLREAWYRMHACLLM